MHSIDGSPLWCSAACECTFPSYHWQQRRDGRRVVRVQCNCGRWIGFAPSRPPFVDMADEAASPTEVLDVLLLAEELRIGLRSDGASVWFATAADRRRAPQRLQELMRE